MSGTSPHRGRNNFRDHGLPAKQAYPWGSSLPDMLIDVHCHCNSLSKIIREQVFAQAQAKSDCCFVDSSIDVQSSLASHALSSHYDFIYTSLGFHPFCAENFSEELVGIYEGLIDENPRIVAIGEIGLDAKAQAPLDTQREVLNAWVRLAKRKNLPVVIHNRLDQPQVLDILDHFYPSYDRLVFHCFSYPVHILDRIIRKKGFVSFSLNILRSNKDILDALKHCPLSSLLLETDSPYMKIKDAASTPLDIVKVYQQAAALKGIEQTELAGHVQANAQRVFALNLK